MLLCCTVLYCIFLNTFFQGTLSHLYLFPSQLSQSLQDWEKVVRKNTGGQGVSAWAPTQWMRNCSQTPKYHSGSCRAHSYWTCWDWSRNLSFPAGTPMAFVVTFFPEFRMPLGGSRSKPSCWGLFWHWSDHLGLFCSYLIPFVTWTFWDIFHFTLTWTSPPFFYVTAN